MGVICKDIFWTLTIDSDWNNNNSMSQEFTPVGLSLKKLIMKVTDKMVLFNACHNPPTGKTQKAGIGTV